MKFNPKQVFFVLLIFVLLYFLFYHYFHIIEGYDVQINTDNDGSDVQITSSNGATQTIYDTSFVDLFFTSDTSANSGGYISNNIPINYYADNGTRCILSNNTIEVTTVQGAKTTYVSNSSSTSSTNITDQVFYDNNGGYAKIFSDGIHYFVEVQPYNAPLFVLTSSPPVQQLPPPSATPLENAYPYIRGGIPYSMIPPGDEDLYILKSEVVPPVCPKCPDYNASSDSAPAKCPPCPACARCPEPSFECKKVPNYQTLDPNALPSPILNDFSAFGI